MHIYISNNAKVKNELSSHMFSHSVAAINIPVVHPVA